MTQDYVHEQEDELEAELEGTLFDYLDRYLDKLGQDVDLWSDIDSITGNSDRSINIIVAFTTKVYEQANRGGSYQLNKVR